MTAPASDLRAFLDLLRRERQLVEVAAPVASDQEIPEIHRRVAAADGPALLFTSVDGGTIPVASNLFGSRRRAELGFGTIGTSFVKEAVRLVEEMPPTLPTLWAHRGLLGQALRIGARRVGRGPVTEVMEEPALDRMPITKLWPEDGGAFVTLPLVLTRHPATGVPNLGIYRMQRHDARSTGMHWQIGKGGGFHYHVAEERGEALPVTVMVGGPPALILSAAAPLPEGVPELLLASLLAGRRLPVVRGVAGAHDIVATCEMAFVGRVPPRERRPEGPFGDHYGYYSLAHPYPVFHVDRVCRRRNPIWPATVVGKPRQEDYYIGDMLQELLSPLFPLVMPSVRSLWSYGETGFHPLSAAVVHERYGREAMMSAFRILGEGQLSLTKFLMLVDRPMDLKDFPAVLAHVLARVRWETDLYVFSHLSMDTLDYAGPEVNKGSKGVILALGDAWRELPREWRGAPPPFVLDPRVFCPGCLVVGGAPYGEDAALADRVAAAPELAAWPLVVLCDRPGEAAASTLNFLWTTFTRFEPAADIHAASVRLVRGHPSYSGPLVIDARMKPWYPKEVFAAPEIAAQVERRWTEYFPGGGVAMGSSDRAHLA